MKVGILIFTIDLSECSVCHEPNAIFTEVKPMGEVLRFGSFCPHHPVKILPHAISRRDAINFLEAEMAMAKDNLKSAIGDRRDSFLELISKLNRALFILRGMKYKKAA